MAFRMNGGWVSFNGVALGSGDTKQMAKSSAVIRNRFNKPMQMIAVAGLLALSLMGCDAGTSYTQHQCNPTILAMKNDRHQRLTCSISGQIMAANQEDK